MSSGYSLHMRDESGAGGSVLQRRLSHNRLPSDDLKEALLGGQRATPSLRRLTSHRRLKASATAGWIMCALLLLVLVFSHSTAAPDIPKLDLAHLELKRPPSTQATSDLGRDELAAALNNTASAHALNYRSSPVTIVTSFYQIKSGRKHRVSEYHEWLANFLGSVEQPIVFYCSPSMSDFVKTLRGNKPLTIIDTYKSPFDMPPLIELGGLSWAKAQHRIDPERLIHVPELYGVWTAKPWMVKHAKDLNLYNSQYFFWADAGAFREAAAHHTFEGLPKALDAIFDTLPEDTLLLASTERSFPDGTKWVKEATPTGEMDRNDYLQGGWFGGRAPAVDWWAKEILVVTKLQAGMLRFSAKEQPIWTQTARLNWPKIYVQNMALAEGDCGPDKWFTFEYIADGKDCVVPAWSGPQELAKAPLRTQDWSKYSAASLEDAATESASDEERNEQDS